MKAARIALFIAVAAAGAQAAGIAQSACDIATLPAATLLLPYFEVDINSPASKGVNTIFTVVNTSRTPQIARVTIWTDLGYPVSWFNIFLTGFDAQTVSLYEVIARGRFPITSTLATPGALSAPNNANAHIDPAYLCQPFGGVVSPLLIAKLQRVLTTGERDGSDCPVGRSHANAIGYITIDVINSCSIDSPLSANYWTSVLLFDNVLTGDSIRINPDVTTGNYAGASPLVHIRAVPDGGEAGSTSNVPFPFTFYDRFTPRGARNLDRRQPLPSTFAARYIEGGGTGFETSLTLWRETPAAPAARECDYAPNASVPLAASAIVRFDEHENATSLAADSNTAVTSSLTTASSLFPPAAASGDRGGWMWLSLDHGKGSRPSQNWVSVQMSAEGRYAVDFDATWIVNGCTAVPAAP